MPILAPDGTPLTNVKLVGAPELDELQPFTPEDMIHVATPLREALSLGVPFEAPATVELGIVCRLVATVLHLQAASPGEGEE